MEDAGDRPERSSPPADESPFVSSKQPTQQLHDSYKNADPADPIYVEKSKNLAAMAPRYRTTRRDGSCGFRALYFCYFESIAQEAQRQATRLQEERQRLDAMTASFTQFGYPEIAYESWVEETTDLFDEISSALAAGASSDTAIATAFDDEARAPALIQHFRTMVSCWMATHPEEYAAYVPDGMTVDQYRHVNIDVASSEMEELSLRAATDMLLDAANIRLEVYYLDRTPGDKATVHQYEPKSSRPDGPYSQPLVQLLYRPGHYDILYGPGTVGYEPE